MQRRAQKNKAQKKTPRLKTWGQNHNNCLTFRSIPNCNVIVIFNAKKAKLFLI